MDRSGTWRYSRNGPDRRWLPHRFTPSLSYRSALDELPILALGLDAPPIRERHDEFPVHLPVAVRHLDAEAARMHDGLPMRLPVAVRGFDTGAARVRHGEFPMHLPVAVLDCDAGAIRVRRDDLPMRLPFFVDLDLDAPDFGFEHFLPHCYLPGALAPCCATARCRSLHRCPHG